MPIGPVNIKFQRNIYSVKFIFFDLPLKIISETDFGLEISVVKGEE